MWDQLVFRRTILVVLFFATSAAHAQQITATRDLQRVRSGDRTVVALLEKARAASPTFRSLVDAIHATNGLVYVTPGRCLRRIPACLVMSVTMAGPYRLLHITVDVARTDIAVQASVAHELRHALEILSEPSVTTGSAAFYLYDRYRRTMKATVRGGEVFETHAAIRAEVAVRKELEEASRHPRDPASRGLSSPASSGAH